MKKILFLFLAIICFEQNNYSQILPATKEEQLAGHPISFYLSNAHIPQICKDLFNKKIPISDDNEVLALMDSMFTKNNETRPFYILTIAQTMEKADGAFAEPLGFMAKKFIETKTREFINYFITEPTFTDKYFDEWASTVAGEIEIIAENQEKKELEKAKNILKANCNDCNERQKHKINDFINKLTKYCTQNEVK